MEDDFDTRPPMSSFTAINTTDARAYSPVTNLLLQDGQHSSISEDNTISRASSVDLDLEGDINDLLNTEWPSRSPEDYGIQRSATTKQNSQQSVHQPPNFYDQVCNEALEYYESEVPPFCIRERGAKTKMVEEITTGKSVELKFRSWPDTKSFGY